ncbi:MAG: helix-turn-helix domain-containing protein, partial [Hyphomicrobiaceae bacterium]|nr:helix-turn-helix domain-containing protein [Hyphomicrobiaceae bacterium]
MPKHSPNLAPLSAHEAADTTTDRQSTPPKLAYTIKEWCAAVGTGPTKTYAEIKAGRLKTVWIGGRRLILAEDGLEYLRSGRVHAKPPG